MKLFFLPHVREGLAPTTISGARPRVPISLTLEAAGRTSRDITNVMPLLGPGDVIGIEPRQVLRVTPSPGTRDAEPEFFPAIEFDAPDLPWAYSPGAPDTTRLLPWLVLVVIESTPDVVLANGERGQSPWILRLDEATARRELPELVDTWAWAHAQVACETPAAIGQTLAQAPDRTLSRVLAPRRLLPFRSYRACVVPAFLSGVVAGLGGDPATEPSISTGFEPAWTSSRVPTTIPVYYTWSFRTGEAGDFESLAQRLHAAPLDASIPPLALHLALPAGDGRLEVDWEPPLRAPGTATSRPSRPPAAVAQITDALRPGPPARPVLGPAYFGSPWTDSRALAPVTLWPAQLNTTPMLRAAAGLGADAVRAEQEALVTAVSAQLDEFTARQREGRRAQFAAAVTNRVKARLAAAPAAEKTRVFAPITARTQPGASNAGLYTLTGRRVIRKVSRVAAVVRPAPVGGVVDAPVVAAEGPISGIPTLEPLPDLLPAIEYKRVVARPPVTEPPPPIAPVNPTTIPTGQFAPRLDRPLGQVLAEQHPELMLPNADRIAPDSVLLVEAYAPFIEAFLVGANQELAYELLWRGLPADRHATAFTRFWPHSDAGADIGAIGSWAAESAVGTHLVSTPSMVLVVRSELVRRYPTLLIAAVPARRNADGSRSPAQEASALRLPVFRGRIGPDVLYAGFAAPTIADAIGVTARDGNPGWFLLLSENPGDPRFGLDPVAISPQPTRATLAWPHLSLPPGARHATVAAFPSVSDANFSPATATAASIANLTQQRPFRAFLHASLLVRLPGAAS